MRRRRLGPIADVVDNRNRHRFEIRTDGELAGFVTYKRGERRITFVHTEIDDNFEGRGLGSELIAAALEAAREEGLEVVPVCPFVRAYIERHTELAGLVPADVRRQMGMAAG